MHFKTILTPVALAALVAADVTEPCAQVSKLVADANQDKGAF
jgi:hypothetical protein